MARDFRAKNIRTSLVIGSGSIDDVASPQLRLAFYPKERATNHDGARTGFNLSADSIGDDVWCVFGSSLVNGAGDPSGEFPNPDANTEHTGNERANGSSVLFTGNVVVSGSLYAERQMIEVDNTTAGDFYTNTASNNYFAGGYGSSGVTITNTGAIKSDEGLEADYLKTHADTELLIQSVGSGDIVFKRVDANGTDNLAEVFRMESSNGGSLRMASGKKIEFADTGEYIVSDGTNLSIASGGDIIIPGATTKLEWGGSDSGEHIVGDGSNGLNLAAGTKINLTSPTLDFDATTAVTIDTATTTVTSTTSATVTSPIVAVDSSTSIALDTEGGVLLRNTGIHIGGTGTNTANLATLTANGSPIRIWKALAQATHANDSNAAAYPFDSGGAAIANTGAGTLMISNRTSFDGNGKASGKIYFDGSLVAGALTAADLIVEGDLTVQGTVTTLNTETITTKDRMIDIGGGDDGAAPGGDDSKDRGISFQYHNGSNPKKGFFGYDRSEHAFAFIPDATINSSGVVSGNLGHALFSRYEVNGTANHISLAGSDLTLTASGTAIVDAADDIVLDSGTGTIDLNDGSNRIGRINLGGNNLSIKSSRPDGDIILQGNDNGNAITALTLDMSEAGAATFNSGVTAGAAGFVVGNAKMSTGKLESTAGHLTLKATAANQNVIIEPAGSEVTISDAAAQLNFNDTNARIFRDSGNLKFRDATITTPTTLANLAVRSTDDDSGAWRGTDGHGSPALNKARSVYTVLLNYGGTDDGEDWLDDHANPDVHFLVKSTVGAKDAAGINSHLILSQSLTIVDSTAGGNFGASVIKQDNLFTRFGTHESNQHGSTPHRQATRTIQNIMSLKPGGAAIGGIYLGDNQGLFFSDGSDDAALRMRRVTHTVEGTAGEKCIQIKGHLLPQADNAFNLGTADRRFANLYTGDLHLNNVGSSNDVDGTAGNWTIQEGKDSLFVINNLTGKKFKMMLQPVEDGE